MCLTDPRIAETLQGIIGTFLFVKIPSLHDYYYNEFLISITLQFSNITLILFNLYFMIHYITNYIFTHFS